MADRKKPLKKSGNYKLKINPLLKREHEEAVKEGYKGDVKEYFKEYYGDIGGNFKKGGLIKGFPKLAKKGF
jgi:hypothetical protein